MDQDVCLYLKLHVCTLKQTADDLDWDVIFDVLEKNSFSKLPQNGAKNLRAVVI